MREGIPWRGWNITGTLFSWKQILGLGRAAVMAGLDPAIHVLSTGKRKTWMTGTKRRRGAIVIASQRVARMLVR
jgi:hypothetical protein